MSSPFLIWTMQRTGGTSLTELLMEMSEHRSAEHEPFNWAKKQPRQFWPITEAWNTSHNAEVLRASLEGPVRAALPHQALLRAAQHVVQHASHAGRGRDRPTATSSCAAGTSPRASCRSSSPSRRGRGFKDYARKVFTQVAEGDRKLAPLPVDRVVGHYRHSEDSTAFINDTLASLDVPRLEVWYEDLYTGGREARLSHLHGLFDFLGFTPEEVAEHRALIDEKIFQSGQNTRSVASLLPNLGGGARSPAGRRLRPSPGARSPRACRCRARRRGRRARATASHANARSSPRPTAPRAPISRSATRGRSTPS